jgi:glycine/D-amino acid oxidase-like deaminating enzyme
MSEPNEYDAVIIGGGISGLTVAHHLKKRDKNLQVLVLEAKGLQL